MADVPAWYTDFVAAVVARLPRDIDDVTAQHWIRNSDALEHVLRGLLSSADAGLPLKNDKSGEGWRLLEDVTEPPSISAETLELAAFLEEGEGDLLGDEMVERARAIGSKLGQRHAEYLLSHDWEIPEDFRRYSLIFPGTVWLAPDGNHHVPCLNWRQGKWELAFGILEGGVESRDRLVRPRS